MSDEAVGVSIKILDKDYRIACEPNEQAGLIASAQFLDQRMREIRQTGRVIGTDRIAVLAALNLAHELLQLRQGQPADGGEHAQRLGQLQARIAQVLSAETTLDASAERV